MKKIVFLMLFPLILACCSAGAGQETGLLVSNGSEGQETAAVTAEKESDTTKETDTDTRMKYRQITQEEAKELMKDAANLVLDVRRPDEYAEGHIPGAVNVPNEEIGAEAPSGLPDRTQVLLVYCRSGRRSKEASQKLAVLGYTNVYEFGGILDWTGDVVTGAAETEKSAAKHVITLHIDSVEVPVAWSADAAETIDALKALAAENPLTIKMSPYGGFEQVGSVGQSLPRKDVRITTGAGDIVLYSGDQIVIFYGSNTWEYTFLGRIGLPAENMKTLLGGEGVTVTFDLSE